VEVELDDVEPEIPRSSDSHEGICVGSVAAKIPPGELKTKIEYYLDLARTGQASRSFFLPH